MPNNNILFFPTSMILLLCSSYNVRNLYHLPLAGSKTNVMLDVTR